MVLPGIQALFGFQLVAVFNQRFEEFSAFEQRLHFLALSLIAISITLVMSPAAFHRHRGAREVSDTFILVSTRLLLAAMMCLALGLSLDFYLIARLILDETWVWLFALGLFAALIFFWVVFPRAHLLQRALAAVSDRHGR